jgi:DNA-directed RNA polymerase II subunit RPB1
MNAQRLFKIDSRSKDTSLDPLKCIEGLEQLEMKLEVVKGSDPLSKEAQHNATMMIKYLLHGALASKIVCRDYRLSEEAWDWVLGEIEIRWFKSLGHVTFALPFFLRCTVMPAHMPRCTAPPGSVVMQVSRLPSQAGEMCGSLAAQSIGEPATQVRPACVMSSASPGGPA